MEKKKKVALYLFIALISVFLFYYLNSVGYKRSGYDTSQQGFSEKKGQFIPEQKTDYIFTTLKVENDLDNKIILFIFLIIVAIVIVVVRKKLSRKES